MGLFENFPYSNFHEMNLDYLIKRIESLERKIKKLSVGDSSEAIRIANEAKAVANNASAKAETAQTTANSASAKAETAQTTANSASAKAETAQTTANSASAKAVTATEEASNALSIANGANSRSVSAIDLGNEALDISLNVETAVNSLNKTTRAYASVSSNVTSNSSTIYSKRGNVVAVQYWLNCNTVNAYSEVVVASGLPVPFDTQIEPCGSIDGSNGNYIMKVRTSGELVVMARDEALTGKVITGGFTYTI